MAKVTVVETYENNIQAQPEKTYFHNGVERKIAARNAGKAKMMIAQYDEVTLQFQLPDSFQDNIKAGDVLIINCPSLEKVKPFFIYNVDRVIKSK